MTTNSCTREWIHRSRISMTGIFTGCKSFLVVPFNIFDLETPHPWSRVDRESTFAVRFGSHIPSPNSQIPTPNSQIPSSTPVGLRCRPDLFLPIQLWQHLVLNANWWMDSRPATRKKKHLRVTFGSMLAFPWDSNSEVGIRKSHFQSSIIVVDFTAGLFLLPFL